MSLFSITAKASGWKAVISALRCIGEESSFEVTSEGLKFYSIDTIHINVLSMIWKKENMEELSISGQDKKLGFRTDDLDKIFKRFAADDIITISQESDNGYLHIQSKNKTFDIRTLDGSVFDGTDMMPKIDFDVTGTILPDDFKKSITDVSVFDDTNIHFITEKGTIHLKSEDQAGKCKSEMNVKNVTILKDSDTRYDTSNIIDVLSAVSTLCSKIKINYSTDKPILLEFEINDAGVMQYFLAHKTSGR